MKSKLKKSAPNEGFFYLAEFVEITTLLPCYASYFY